MDEAVVDPKKLHAVERMFQRWPGQGSRERALIYLEFLDEFTVAEVERACAKLAQKPHDVAPFVADIRNAIFAGRLN